MLWQQYQTIKQSVQELKEERIALQQSLKKCTVVDDLNGDTEWLENQLHQVEQELVKQHAGWVI